MDGELLVLLVTVPSTDFGVLFRGLPRGPGPSTRPGVARGLPRGRGRAGDAWERFVGVAIVSLKFRGPGRDFHLLTAVGAHLPRLLAHLRSLLWLGASARLRVASRK